MERQQVLLLFHEPKFYTDFRVRIHAANDTPPNSGWCLRNTRLWYNTFTNREPTKFISLSKYIGVVFNSISCCVLNNTVTNRVRRTRVSRAARGRFAPGVNARCVLITSFVYFTAFVYNFRGYRDELAKSPAKSKL